MLVNEYEDSGFGRFSLKKARRAIKKTVTAPLTATKKLNKKLVQATIKKPLTSALSVTKKITQSTVKKPLMLTLKKGPTAKLSSAISKKSPVVASLLMPAESMIKPKQASAGQPVQETVVPDGPLVTIYSPDGSVAEIPSNYLTNGTYSESGVMWSTTPPKMATIYSAYGDVAEIPESMLTLGRYTDQDGNIWSTTPPSQTGTVTQQIVDELSPATVSPSSTLPVPYSYYPEEELYYEEEEGYPEEEYYEEEESDMQTKSQMQMDEDSVSWLSMFFQKIADALRPSRNESLSVSEEELQGFGEAATGTNFLDTLNANMAKVQKLQEAGKAYGSAFRSTRRKFIPKKEEEQAIVPPAKQIGEPDKKLLGMPPAVVYGGAAVGISGLAILLIKMKQSKKKG